MARKPVESDALGLPVAVRFAPDQHAWLIEAGKTHGIPAVVRDAVRRLRRQAEATDTTSPSGSLKAVDGALPSLELNQLERRVEQLATTLGELVIALKASHQRDEDAFANLRQQLGGTTQLLYSIAKLLSPDTRDIRKTTVVESWEGRRSS